MGHGGIFIIIFYSSWYPVQHDKANIVDLQDKNRKSRQLCNRKLLLIYWFVYFNRGGEHDDVMTWKPFPYHWPFATANGGFFYKGPIICNVDVFVTVSLNNLSNKQSSRRTFDTPWRSCDVTPVSQPVWLPEVCGHIICLAGWPVMPMLYTQKVGWNSESITK